MLGYIHQFPVQILDFTYVFPDSFLITYKAETYWASCIFFTVFQKYILPAIKLSWYSATLFGIKMESNQKKN